MLPNIAGVGKTVNRIEGGDVWWLALGVVLELLSFAGYVVLFRVGARPQPDRAHRLAREL